MGLRQYRRPGTIWYVSDGYVWDDLPKSYRRDPGRPLECSSKLFVFNPQAKPARVRVRFFRVHEPPTATDLRVKPGKVAAVELASLPEVPHGESFWIAVESDRPVLPQARHEDYTSWDPVPDALVAVAPYPGPLQDETAWVFPDCYESDPVRGWHEYETLTILNPGTRPVQARIRYLLRGHELGGEEEIEVPAERVAQLDVWKRTPRLLGTRNGPPVHVVGDYAVRIDASGPVVTQTTRRARWVGRPSIIGARSTMGFPLGTGKQALWYYPGGAVIDRGVLPRARETDHPLSQCDNTWNLLFINNVDAEREAHATVMFHGPDGTRGAAETLAIAPLKSRLECLHGKPWLGRYTAVGEPFGMTVTADRAVIPEVTSAEFEMWSQVCPGAMSAVNLYPGPLRQERTWWLGVGEAGGADDVNTEWSQSYHLMNPGEKPVEIRLSFLGMERQRRRTHAVTVGPGAVAVVESREIEGLPLGKPFVVRADGDRAFCAQMFARTFTRGLAPTRAMYSFMGTPMALED